MLVYFITIALVLAMCWINSLMSPSSNTSGDITLAKQKAEYKKSKDYKIIILVVFLVLAFVAAFRYRVGTDFHAYYRTNLQAGKFAEGDFGDPGFTLFAKFASFLFGGRNGAVTILAAIVTVALFVFTIAKRSENLTVSLLLFIFIGCFTGMFNGVRQYLATGILFAGFHYVPQKKFFKWLIIVLIASSIHVTAILMLFAYFICNIKCNFVTIILYFIVALILLYLYEPLFNLVGALKQEEIDSTLSNFTRHVNVLRVLVQCVPLVMFFFVGKDSINKDADCRALFNICLLNAAIAIASINSVYFARFYIYTMCFQILMYPKIFSKLSKNDRRIFTTLLVFFFSIFWLYETSKSSSLINFQWIFNYL